jgi:hypothetical protein
VELHALAQVELPQQVAVATSSAAMAKRRIDVLLVGLDAKKTGHHA